MDAVLDIQSPPPKTPYHPIPPSRLGKKKPKSPHSQGVEIQKLLHKDAVEAPDGKTRAFIARSWCDVNEEVRKLAMRALPRPIDTTKHSPNGRRSRSNQAAPVEPVEPAVPSKET